MKNNAFSLYSHSALYSRSSRLIAGLALSLAGMGMGPDALALPQGATVSSGQVSVSQPTSSQEVITQTSDKSVINWQSFNILNDESTKFIQPSANSISLDRVTGGNASQILGSLSANGHVWLVNQNGVFIGPSAQINVGGLIASTADISDKNFLKPKNGQYNFDRPGKADASVINQGHITATQGGLVALVAPGVRNDGIITAKAGTVVLGGGQTATIDLYGDHLYSFAIGQATTKQAKDQNGNLLPAAVTNTGTISAQGGTVYLTARAAKDVVDQAINTTGIVDATAAHMEGGTIVLDGGDGAVNVAGTLDASGKKTGQTGGNVQVLGNDITLADNATIDASGSAGGGQVNIGGGLHGQGALPHAQKVTAKAGSVVNVSATDNGNGGTAVLWSDGATQFDGTILSKGGANGGNGGLVETSGHTLSATGTVDASAAKGNAGTWLLDPNNITIQASGSDTNVSGNPNFTSTDDSAVVTTSSIDAALNGGTNVSVTTASNGANTQSGVITVADNISKTAGGNASLTLQAASDIIINGGVSIGSTAGKLNVTLDANTAGNGGAIVLNSGSAIASNGGNITLGGGANPLLTGAVGDATSSAGINLFNASLNAAGGNISLLGTGTGGTDVNAIGVFASTGTSIATAGAGTITINGTGGGTGSSHNDHGVEITASSVSAADGNITLTGTGGNGDGGTNGGVIVQNGSIVQTSGAGNISLNGAGGTATGQDNWGVGVLSSTISANGSGNVTLTGSGGTSSGGYNEGVYIAGPNTISTTTGALTFKGTGGTGGNGYNEGVFMQDANNVVQSTAGGNVAISGTSGSGGTNNDGVYLLSDSQISTTGAGTVTITGTGVDNGILFDGKVSTMNGDITFTGNGTNGNGIITGQEFPNTTTIGGASENGNITLSSIGNVSLSSTIQTAQDITIDAVNTLFPYVNSLMAGGTLAVNNSGIFSSNEAGILNGNTVTLNQNGGSPNSSIQNAISAVGTTGSGGATLTVGSGVWDETLAITQSNFNLVGSGAGNTILRPSSVVSAQQVQDGPPNGAQFFSPMLLVQNADNVNISGLTIDGTLLPTVPTGAVTPAGLVYNNAAGAINSVMVVQNGAPSLVAIDSSAYGQTAHTVNATNFAGTSTDRATALAIGDKLTFNMAGSNLTGSDNMAAMDYAQGSTGSFTNNTVNTSGYQGVGVGFHGADNVLVDSNIITGNGTGSYGIYSYVPDSNLTIANNTITNIGSGIVARGNDWAVLNNTITAASGSTGNGIELHLLGNNTIGNTAGGANTINGFQNGILDTGAANIVGNIINGSQTGVNVEGGFDVNIVNNQISGGVNGVNANSSYAIAINANRISGSGDGIDVANTQNVSVLGNVLVGSGSGTGIGFNNVSGTAVIGDAANTLPGGDGNNVNGYDSNISIAGGSNNVQVASNIITNATTNGILVSDSNNANLLGNGITGNLYGIQLSNAQNARVDSEVLSDNTTGLYINNGSGGTIVTNTAFSGGNTGVLLDGTGSSMQFAGNTSSFASMPFYFILRNGAMFGDTLDASQQTFDGVIAHNFTRAQFVTAEEKTIDLHEDQTIPLNNTPGQGTVFYTTFPAPVTPPPTITPTFTAAVTAPTGFNTAFDQFLLLNDRLPFGGSLFSYAGHTIASTITELPYNFRVQEVNLSLLTPNAGGGSTVNLAQATTGELNNLAPAAGGDAGQLAALSPAAGGLPDCANNFLGVGYALNYDNTSCRTVGTVR